MGIPDLPLDLTRRSMLKAGALAAGSVAWAPRSFDRAAAAAPAHHGIFGYGVASGDPTADSLIIWTRTAPPLPHGQIAEPGSGLGKPLTVQWEMATDPTMRHVVKRGHLKTSPASDHTVKVDVTGLDAYTRYYYQFRARGERSLVGRTQTAPDVPGQVHALRMALVSCSNYTGGYFTAYRAIAARDDLDFVLHVGDYIYEYGNGEDRYGPDALVGVRDHEPPTETLTLRDYRLRHALHKADPDSQDAHRLHPWVTIFDDHEVTNDTWSDGAENHDPREGDFQARRSAAYQAYLEWMPFRLPEQRVPHDGTQFFRRFTFGDLATLSVLETRQNRSQQIGGFIPLGVPGTDAAMEDPDRHMPEPEQMAWLKEGISTTTAPWHLIGQQTVLTRVLWPGQALGAPAGTVLVNADQWDGYRADQRELIEHLGGAAADSVVLTGDIHSSWANELVADVGPDGAYRSNGAEFVAPSVTSDGFYEIVGASATSVGAALATTRAVTAAVQKLSPWVKYLDGIGHGYVLVDVTPQRVQADFYLTPEPTPAMPDPRVVATSVEPRYAASFGTYAGTRTVRPMAGRVGPRVDHPS